MAMSTIALMLWLWTNSAGQVESTSIEGHAPPGAATVADVSDLPPGPAPLPALFESGVAVPRDGHWWEFVPHDGAALAVPISDSPVIPEIRDARIADAVMSATANRSAWRSEMRALRGTLATNITEAQTISALTGGYTAGEARQSVNALRRELIDALRDINSLRRVLMRYAREESEETP